MFARYKGEGGAGLIPKEVYYITIVEEVRHYNFNNKPHAQRLLNISVGDYWSADYESFGEAMMEWEFEQWKTSHQE